MADGELPLVPHDDEESGAERAFNQLTAEIVVLRRSVAAMHAEKAKTPGVDYSPTLGALKKAQDEIAADIADVAAHTGANLPDGFFRAEVQRGVAAGLEFANGSLQGASSALRQAIDNTNQERARLYAEYKQWWLPIAGAGMLAGIVAVVLLVLLSHALPERWGMPGRIAAAAMGETRWQAGQHMMNAADPDSWRGLVDGSVLRDAGGKPLADCYARAMKAGKPVKCAVTMVPVAK